MTNKEEANEAAISLKEFCSLFKYCQDGCPFWLNEKEYCAVNQPFGYELKEGEEE